MIGSSRNTCCTTSSEFWSTLDTSQAIVTGDDGNVTTAPTMPTAVTIKADTLTTALNIFQAYVVLPVVILGIFGNTMSIAIFSRSFKRDSATSQYCVALAVSDCSMVILVGLKNWLSEGLAHISSGQLYFNPLVASNTVCKILRYLEQTCMFLSSWFIVCFSAERCFAVWNPFKRLSFLTSRRRITAILTLIGTACVFKTYVAVFFTVFDQAGQPSCWYPPHMSPSDKMLLLMIDIFSNIGIPCILIFAFNIAISYRIVRSTSVMSQTSDSNDLRNRQRREIKTVVNLLCISTFFFVCTMPTVVMWSYVDYVFYVKQESTPLFTAALFTDSLTILNYSLNFIIYGVSLDFYRRELFHMLFCKICKETPKISNSPNNSSSALEQKTVHISTVSK